MLGLNCMPTWARITADRKISDSPVMILAVSMMCGAGGAGTVTLHDGQTSGDETLIVFGTAASETETIVFDFPLITSKGLYADLSANAATLTVQYVPFNGWPDDLYGRHNDPRPDLN